MSPELSRAFLVLLLALLLAWQARRAGPLRRRAFTLISGGVALAGLGSIAAFLALPQMLSSTLALLGLALLVVGLFFLVRAWQSGELQAEVQRYRRLAAEERERLEAERRRRNERKEHK